jgi:hypothetical protein
MRDWDSLDLESWLLLTANALDTADVSFAIAFEDHYQMVKRKDPDSEEILRVEIERLRPNNPDMARQLENALDLWIKDNN